MSNTEASKLYEAVIEEVISDSRQDFENSGIDESTLQDLKKIWCERLSQAGVAKFSWDEEEVELPSTTAANDVTNSGINQDSIKLEQDGNQLNSNNNLELLNETNYNDETNNVNPNTNNHNNTNNNESQIKLETPEISHDYDENNGLILPRVNQADGTFEFTVYTDGDKNEEFMNKLKLRNKQRKQNKGSKTVKQADGADDDDDDDDDDDIFNDSDDINSDLDDGLESEKSDDEDGDQEGQIMLCLYDKVQRVKNKWKSNLKEGVANIDGRDYVFQKATGESEW